MQDAATFGVDDLRALGIGFVVYHRDRPFPAVFDHLSGLGLPVVADDGVVLVWRVPGAHDDRTTQRRVVRAPSPSALH